MPRTGAQFGEFRLIAPVGEGATGEVWQAEDLRLRRQVALKILSQVGRDAEILARFRREARFLASLHHPDIAQVYAFQVVEGRPVLVLEYIPGESLAQRLERGPLPLAEALEAAASVAAALEAAHGSGIIHRDLKPANIRLTPEGRVKVLDFGLAKAQGTALGLLTQSVEQTFSGTVQGTLIGTIPYMSPEQARGQPVGRVSDVWAFGCVLFEMLTARRTFGRATSSDSLAAVLGEEPAWDLLPEETSQRVRRLLACCLSKDPGRRLRHFGDVRLELRLAREEIAEAAAPGRQEQAGPGIWAMALPWLVVAAILVAGFWGTIGRQAGGGLRQPAPVAGRFMERLPAGWSLPTRETPSLALSPDGSTLAFIASAAGEPPRLHVRRLDLLDPVALDDTEQAAAPFFSPDGEWIGFFARGQLRKVAVRGGPVAALCSASGYGAAWGTDGHIVFSKGPVGGLWKVAEAGGTPRPMTVTGRSTLTHRWPLLLDDGTLIYTESGGGETSFAPARVLVRRPDGREEMISEQASFAVRLPAGRIGLLRHGALHAVGLGAGGIGEVAAEPILAGIRTFPATGAAQIATASSGAVAYVAGPPAGSFTPVAGDMAGRLRRLAVPALPYRRALFSPDGQRLLLEIAGPSGRLAVSRLTGEAFQELGLPPGAGKAAIWGPGDGLTCLEHSEQGAAIVTRPVPGGDRAGSEEAGAAGEVVLEPGPERRPGAWSPDGKALAYLEREPLNGWDLWVKPRGAAPRLFRGTRYDETDPAFSPDGRWLAYASDESGRREIYVQRYPDQAMRRQISLDGGAEPRWGPGGRRLYYRRQDLVMVVEVDLQNMPSVGRPRVVFQGDHEPGWDVSPATGQVVLLQSDGATSTTQVQMVLGGIGP